MTQVHFTLNTYNLKNMNERTAGLANEMATTSAIIRHTLTPWNCESFGDTG